jgi:hypothetical protein
MVGSDRPGSALWASAWELFGSATHVSGTSANTARDFNVELVKGESGVMAVGVGVFG